MSQCPRCGDYFDRHYFGAQQDDGSWICYDCHCAEFDQYERYERKKLGIIEHINEFWLLPEWVRG